MHDILRNIDQEVQRKRAWLFSIVITLLMLVMLGGNAGEVDTDLILKMNPVSLLTLQGVLSFFMFIVFSLLFARVALKLNLAELFPGFSPQALGLVSVITICFMVVNSGIAEWNQNLNIPDSSFGNWAKQSEEQLKVLTEHLTNFTSASHFIIAFIVVAILPAIGEELLFRGLLQNLFSKALANHHIAIWLTGLIFAGIHMQFYGLVPRMLLGVLFGYIYYWSGKLSLVMIAHLINNGLALLMLFLVQNGTIDLSAEQMGSSAPWSVLLLFGIAGIFLTRIFYKKYSFTNG